ncbi:MAG: hypothetical protein ACOYLX_08605, partial [Burkholderiaceae bacterium]
MTPPRTVRRPCGPSIALAIAGAIVGIGAGLMPTIAQARIVHVEIVRIEPAFGGRSFGTVGAYERVIARAHGELDPAAPANASI